MAQLSSTNILGSLNLAGDLTVINTNPSKSFTLTNNLFSTSSAAMVELSSSATGVAASNWNGVLRVVKSGANVNASVDSYGIMSYVNNTGTTATNRAFYGSLSSAVTNQTAFMAAVTGASTSNYGIYSTVSGGTTNYGVWSSGTQYSFYGNAGTLYNAGSVGIGVTPALATLHITPTVSDSYRGLYMNLSSGASTGGGIRLEATSNGGNQAVFEAIGARIADTNGAGLFGGQVALSKKGATASGVASGNYIGRAIFGGTHTNDTIGNLLYTASINAFADANWTSSTAMATGLTFRVNPAGTAGLAMTSTSDVGVEAMRITSTGTIGVGITAPGNYNLIVKGTTAQQAIASVTTDYVASTTGSLLQFGHVATTGNTAATVSNLTTGGAAWGNLVLQHGGGNVGIGTGTVTAPQDKLEVKGNVRINDSAGTVGFQMAFDSVSKTLNFNYVGA